MGLSVLGGKFKGHVIQLPKNIDFRPTNVMIKRKIFDANQNLSNTYFYDLCAGSGAMGIEALSRGAEKVFLIERSKKNCSLIKSNFASLTDKFHIEKFQFSTFNLECSTFVKRELSCNIESFYRSDKKMIFFIDPPYEETSIYQNLRIELEDMHKKIVESQKCSVDNISLWIESCEQKGLSHIELTQWFNVEKIYKQGSKFLGVFTFKT
jgi:16S rRNA (guanine966-N2)-methyltransferase